MINYFRSIIAGLLVSIGTFVSPAKQIALTPKPKINITITPKAIPTVIDTPTIIFQPQVQKCQFDKEGFIKKAKDYGYTAEEIDAFLTSLPPNYCPNNNVQTDENNLQIVPTISQENEPSIVNESKKVRVSNSDIFPTWVPLPTHKPLPTSSYEYQQPYRYSPLTPIPTIAIDVYGQGGSNYTQYGNTVYGNDGSSYSKYGNTVYGNDGSTYTKYGNTTYGNDGSTCTKYGNSTYCN